MKEGKHSTSARHGRSYWQPSKSEGRDVEAGRGDGSGLRADAYQPGADGQYPVLLGRTPCDKSAEKQAEIGPKLAARGYLVVMQDMRGRYASGGDFHPGFYSAEHDDAEDGFGWHGDYYLEVLNESR